MFHGADQIHGLGPTHQTQLAAAEVVDHDSLLRFCRTHKGRSSVSEKTGLSTDQLHKWTVQAELARIPGMGQPAAFLLEGLGIHSFDDLKSQSATELLSRLTTAGQSTHLLSEAPALEQVESWIADAAILTPKLGPN
jgi:predicted flap endonuclease-1-like 5' DNA nuclease